MIWLLILSAGLLGVGGLVGTRALLRRAAVSTSAALAGEGSLAAAMARADLAVPRDASVVEAVLGTAFVVGALAVLVGPTLLDPLDAGLLGTIVTPVLLGVVGGIGALVAAGPRGRARFGEILALILGLFIAGRYSRRLGSGASERLARLGHSLVLAALLGGLALACFAKPWITPQIERSFGASASVGAPGMRSLPPDLLAELAAHADDPRAASMRAMLGLPPESAPAHFTFEGYTAERNVAWPTTGAVLALLALALVFSPGGLSPARRTSRA